MTCRLLGGKVKARIGCFRKSKEKKEEMRFFVAELCVFTQNAGRAKEKNDMFWDKSRKTAPSQNKNETPLR